VGGGGGSHHRRRHRDDRPQNVYCVSKYTRAVSSKRIQCLGSFPALHFSDILIIKIKKKKQKLRLLQGGQELII
jgi:hypothetical protein